MKRIKHEDKEKKNNLNRNEVYFDEIYKKNPINLNILFTLDLQYRSEHDKTNNNR